MARSDGSVGFEHHLTRLAEMFAKAWDMRRRILLILSATLSCLLDVEFVTALC